MVLNGASTPRFNTVGLYRIYSKRGEERSYLRVDDDWTLPIEWVRSWRIAAVFLTRERAGEAIERAKALGETRPMCVVVWGTRKANLPTHAPPK